MSKQCLDIEQMQHLKELGVDTSKASMVLIVTDPYGDALDWDEEIFGFNEDEKSFEYYDAETGNYDHSFRKDCGVFTLQDTLDLLPKDIKPNRRYFLRIDLADEYIYYYYEDFNLVEVREKSFGYDGMDGLLDAAYEMLCWCIENGYIKTSKEE